MEDANGALVGVLLSVSTDGSDGRLAVRAADGTLVALGASSGGLGGILPATQSTTVYESTACSGPVLWADEQHTLILKSATLLDGLVAYPSGPAGPRLIQSELSRGQTAASCSTQAGLFFPPDGCCINLSGPTSITVRAPGHVEHRFRRKPNTHSDASRTLIPTQAEHRFRAARTA